MNNFYMRLREVRKARGITQEELAEQADISRVMVSRYETGSVIPTVDVLIRLADALDISIDYLLGRKGYSDHSSSTLFFSPRIETLSPVSKDMPKDSDELRSFILNVLKECISPDS